MEDTAVTYPNDWTLQEVQALAERMRAGGTPSRAVKEYWGGDIPFALIEDITASGLYLEQASERLTQEGLESSSAWIVPPGAVLLSMYATIGATVVNRIPVATNQAILAIQPKKGYSAEFLALSLRAHKDALARLNVESTQKNISKGIVSTFKLPVPPLPEQQRIAQVLSTVQEAIAQQERLIRTTTELKQALMQKLFTEGLRGEALKETEIGRVPESWEVVKLGSLGHVGNGSTPKRTENGYWDGGTNPWLNSTKIHERFIEHADQFVTERAMKECHLPIVPANSLLIAITGQGKTLGNVALTRIDATINQHLAYVRFSNTQVEPEFLMWYLSTQYDQLRSVAHGAGSTKGALTCSYLKSLLVPMPSLNEQRAITDVLSKLEDKARTAERKRNALQDLFRTLLHELMTGKVRVGEMAHAETTAP